MSFQLKSQSDQDAAPPPSFEPLERSRLIPRISFKMMMGVTLVGAIIFAIARSANEGAHLGSAFLIALGYLVAFFAVLIFWFLVSLGFSVVWKKADPDLQEGSPFAKDQMPPQWIPPRERSS